MTVKRRLIARLAAGAIATGLAATAIATPAHAAASNLIQVTRPGGGNGTVHFHTTYGASILDGDVSFSNRSVNITGTIKAVSATRTAEFVSFDAGVTCFFLDYADSPAGQTTRFGSISETCNVRGGLSEVDILFPY